MNIEKNILDVIFEIKVTGRIHIERTVAKGLGTYIRNYSIFKGK